MSVQLWAFSADFVVLWVSFVHCRCSYAGASSSVRDYLLSTFLCPYFTRLLLRFRLPVAWLSAFGRLFPQSTAISPLAPPQSPMAGQWAPGSAPSALDGRLSPPSTAFSPGLAPGPASESDGWAPGSAPSALDGRLFP